MAKEDSTNTLVSSAGGVMRHARTLLGMSVASALGIVATAGLQIVAIRGLGASAFGLFAAFLALLNIAAIGSAALRNSTAVSIAQTISEPTPLRKPSRFDSSMVEALLLGMLCTVGILAASSWLSSSVDSDPVVLILVGTTVVPYFLFARGLGLLQGVGRARSVIWWTTLVQVAQFALAVAAIQLGYGAIGVLSVYAIAIILATIGATFQAKGIFVPAGVRAFSSTTLLVLSITLVFAWLTNIDVVLVRANSAATDAGAFAAAAVLVKTTLILPSLLSIYLLPKFVTNKGNRSATQRGVLLTILVTITAGLAIFAVLSVASKLITGLLFGPGYDLTVSLLPMLALAWIPWAACQALIVRVLAVATKGGLVTLLVIAALQWLIAVAVLPNIRAMIFVNGLLGIACFVALYFFHHRMLPKHNVAA